MLLLLDSCAYKLLIGNGFLYRFGSEQIFWGRSFYWVFKVPPVLAETGVCKVYNVCTLSFELKFFLWYKFLSFWEAWLISLYEFIFLILKIHYLHLYVLCTFTILGFHIVSTFLSFFRMLTSGMQWHIQPVRLDFSIIFACSNLFNSVVISLFILHVVTISNSCDPMNGCKWKDTDTQKWMKINNLCLWLVIQGSR